MKNLSSFARLQASVIVAAAALLLPLSAFAQTNTTAGNCIGNSSGANTICTFIVSISGFIDTILVPFIFAIAFIVFIFGVYRYFIQGGANEEKRQEGQKFVMWGLVGFFVMFSIWGLVNLLVGTFGFDKQQRPDLPTFNRGTTQQQSQTPAAGTAADPTGIRTP